MKWITSALEPLLDAPLLIFNMIDNSDHKLGVIEDKEGNKRYSFEINGDNFVFIDGKREEEKEEE